MLRQADRAWDLVSHNRESHRLGIDIDRLADAAKLDEAISEFSRFYLERRAQEMQAAGGDERKRKKLEDEFTPRLEMTLVALDGTLHRQVKVKAQYRFDAESEYLSMLTVTPHTGELVDAPELGRLRSNRARLFPRRASSNVRSRERWCCSISSPGPR